MFLICYDRVPVALLHISVLALMSNNARVMFVKMQLACME